jgi:hypothetical protein
LWVIVIWYLIFIFRFHKSKLANRPLDIEHVKYTDTTEQTVIVCVYMGYFSNNKPISGTKGQSAAHTNSDSRQWKVYCPLSQCAWNRTPPPLHQSSAWNLYIHTVIHPPSSLKLWIQGQHASPNNRNTANIWTVQRPINRINITMKV